ncbi:glycosyl transferase [Aureococcus anophagefferens]|nr:glycosyl transferase [Aureococcus anophagefferens]
MRRLRGDGRVPDGQTGRARVLPDLRRPRDAAALPAAQGRQRRRASDRRSFAAFAAAPRASTDAPRSRDDDAAAEAPRTDAAPVAVVPFDADRYLANVTLSAPRGPSYGNLRSPLNFARFYLADLLPDADRVVYLDADAVAVRDVADLYDGAFSGSASSVVAAAPRDQRVCYDRNASRPGVFYCGDARARARAALGFPDPEADLEAFNAGVLALHLGRWRSLGLTARFEDLMRARRRRSGAWAATRR